MIPCRILLPCTLFFIFILPFVYLLVTHPRSFRRRHPHTVTTSKLLTDLHALNSKFEFVSDSVVYNRYARVYDRTIRFPNNQQFSFDVWGRAWKNNSFSVVVVVPFDKATQTFTLIREFNVAHNQHVYSFPQGMVEFGEKHTSVKHAATLELEEEAHLKCMDWIYLLDHDEADTTKSSASAIPQDKYQREKVYVYLCTNAVELHDNIAGVDAEEEIEIIHGITTQQVFQLSQAGVLQSNNIAAGLLAVEKLRHLALIPTSYIP